jgi:hypothetical protein
MDNLILDSNDIGCEVCELIIEKIDTTHIKTFLVMDGKKSENAAVYHIGQLSNMKYYDKLEKWLYSTK